MKQQQLVEALERADDDSDVWVDTPGATSYQIEGVDISTEVQGDKLVRTVAIRVV